MAATHDIWIYRATGEAEIRTLAVGATAPDGWSYDIAVIEDEAARSADALSGIKAVADLLEAVAGADVPPDAFEETLRSANERVSTLEAIIDAGKAENERLVAELSASEEELDASAAEILETRKSFEGAEARADRLDAALASVTAELATARGEPARLQVLLDKATTDVARLAGDLEHMRQKRGRTSSGDVAQAAAVRAAYPS